MTETPGVLLADAGYWHQVQMENVINHGIQVLIPPDSGKRKAPVRDGMAAPTRTCGECFRPTVVQSFIESAKG